MMQPEIDSAEFFKEEIARLEHIFRDKAAHVKDKILQDVSVASMGNNRGSSLFYGAVSYLGSSGMITPIKEYSAIKPQITAAKKLVREIDSFAPVIDEARDIINLYQLYAMHEGRHSKKGSLAIAAEITAIDDHLLKIKSFTLDWLKDKGPHRGRQSLVAFHPYIAYVMTLYEEITGKPAHIYRSDLIEDGLKGHGSDFVITCVDMVNKVARHRKYPHQYTRQNIYTAVEKFEKRQPKRSISYR